MSLKNYKFAYHQPKNGLPCVAQRSMGFTLLELVAVIFTVAILSILLWLSTFSTKSNARDQRRLSDMSGLASALELYRQNNNHRYPGDLAPGQPLKDALDTYMASMPHDPNFVGNTTTDYYYKQTNCGNGYALYFSLENKQDNLQPGLVMETAGGDVVNCTGDCQTNEFVAWQPATCQYQYACGTIDDGCGRQVACGPDNGKCEVGDDCSAYQCVPDINTTYLANFDTSLAGIVSSTPLVYQKFNSAAPAWYVTGGCMKASMGKYVFNHYATSTFSYYSPFGQDDFGTRAY